MLAPLPAEVFGTGPEKALLVHGFTGSGGHWRVLEEYWGTRLTALAVNLPGHCGTPPMSTPGEAGYWAVVDALADTIREPATVIGYSQGARLALGLAIRNPHLVRRLILESVCAGLAPSARAERQVADEALALRIERIGVPAFVQEWEQGPLFCGCRLLDEVTQVRMRETRLQHSAAGLASALRCYGLGAQPDLTPLLAEVRLPVLLITGANDVKFSQMSAEIAARCPRASHVSFEGVWHVPHEEVPQKYAQRVLDFLSEQEEGGWIEGWGR